MALPKKLTEADIINIMDATNRFSYLSTDNKKVWFWDCEWENEYAINIGTSMPEMIKWLITFFSSDSFESGKMKVQNELKTVLGIK